MFNKRSEFVTSDVLKPAIIDVLGRKTTKPTHKLVITGGDLPTAIWKIRRNKRTLIRSLRRQKVDTFYFASARVVVKLTSSVIAI